MTAHVVAAHKTSWPALAGDVPHPFAKAGVMLRATLGYRLWKRIYLNAGVDDCIDDPGFWGGIRVDLLDNDLRNLTSVTALNP